MENSKEHLDSAPAFPSLTDVPFGSKGSLPPSSTANISSIFPPPRSVVMGKSSDIPKLEVESSERSRETSEEQTKIKEDASSCETSKGRRSTILDKIEPCPLSSSLYYGGREDMYIHCSNVQSPGSFPDYKKDDDGNDSHFASRGNWWEGSLYY